MNLECGYVFPGAINKGIVAEIKVNGTDKVHAYSLDYDEYVEFGLNEEDKPQQSWACYIFGVCRETMKRAWASHSWTITATSGAILTTMP